MHDKHQWMSHTLLDMVTYCEMNGMGWQREILLDAVAALGWYQADLIADFGRTSVLPSEGKSRGLKQVNRPCAGVQSRHPVDRVEGESIRL